MGDTYTTCYIPLYCGITAIPESFAIGNIQHFSWNFAWWVFNFVTTFANLKYSYMIKDIQKGQQELEGKFFIYHPAIEKAAEELNKTNPKFMKQFLTDYCISNGEEVTNRWTQLAEHLITKYSGGYVEDEHDRPRSVGYPKEWLRDVIKLRGDHFRLPVWKK